MSQVPPSVKKVLERITTPTPLEPSAQSIREASMEAVSELVQMFSKADANLRESIFEATKAYVVQLIEFALWMSIFSIRKNDPALIRQGLLALVVQDGRSDYRDTIIMLTLLCHSARKLGMNDTALIADVLPFARQGGAKLLSEFIGRDEHMRSIESMGYRESQNEKGFTYDQLDYM